MMSASATKAVAMGTTVLKDAASAWNLLHGVTCIYKQPGISSSLTCRIFKQKLCEDLNSMERLPVPDVVDIRRISGDQVTDQDSNALSETNSSSPSPEIIAQIPDGQGIIQIFKKKSLAAHPLVVGKGFTSKDIRRFISYSLGPESSGLTVLGINDGTKKASLIHRQRWLNTYIVSGQFGKATNTFFHTGKILEKARFHRVQKFYVDHVLAKNQAAHQKYAFNVAGVRMDSERAYELASQGLVRPAVSSAPLVYSAKCIKFDLPDFELEISAVNETEGYLCQFVHELGLKLHTVAMCTKIRRVKVGPFDLELALLPKHWTLQHVLENMRKTDAILKDFNLYERDPIIDDF